MTTSRLAKIPPEMQETLLEGLNKALTNWEEYLEVMAKFAQYSFNNSLLIYIQQLQKGFDPSPMVKGFHSWRKDCKRSVKKGEKGIRILAPIMVPAVDKNGNPILNTLGKPAKRPCGFRGISVFDYRQTDGEPLPDKPDTSHVMGDIEGDVPKKLYNGLCQVAKARKITINRGVSKEDMGGAHGTCWFLGKNGTANKIELREGLKPTNEVSTLAHELAHSILHNRDEYLEANAPDSTSIKELEAESTAFLVMKHYGIKTEAKAFDYIIGHNMHNKDITETMLTAGNRINKAYQEIVKIVDTYLKG
jgi:hypothetical protein